MDENELTQLNKASQKNIVKAFYFATIFAFILEIVFTIVLKIMDEEFRYSMGLYVFLYIIMPTMLNLACTLICSKIIKSQKLSDSVKNKALIYALLFIFTVISTVHSFYPVLSCLLVIPIIVSSMLEEKHLTEYIFPSSIISLIISSALAPLFDDTWEFRSRILNSAIVLMVMVFVYVVSRALAYYTKMKNSITYRSTTENKQMRNALIVDSMTGLLNHSEFHTRLHALNENCSKLGFTLSVAVIDADDFKAINDTYGHSKGDEVLIALADIIRECCKNKGLAFRYGGEEFAVIFTEIDQEEAYQIMETTRRRINDLGFAFMNYKTVGVSVGLYTRVDQGETAEDIFNKADAAMYQAKNTGKNKCVIYNSEMSK